jgi:4-hydroxyphenylpyruvate dioxygenase
MKLYYVEFYVGNIIQASSYYEKVYGFSPIFHSGLANGNRASSSVVLQKGNARVILTSPLSQDGEIAEHLRQHGDSVRDIAIEVENIEEIFAQALKNGAEAIMKPKLVEDHRGAVIIAKIKTFGSCVHSLLQFVKQNNQHLPGYESLPVVNHEDTTAINNIDHIAICVKENQLPRWEKYYANIFGCKKVHEESIDTGKTSMRSLAMEFPGSGMKFVFTEPVPRTNKSQIQEFIDFHGDEGVQHVAFASNNILETISFLRQQGVQFLTIPESYYELRRKVMPEMDEKMADLKQLGNLIDKDKDGYLLQTFTKPIQTRPTGFLEIIQRFGAQGFGSGNINALFKAVEMEQQNRGTL